MNSEKAKEAKAANKAKFESQTIRVNDDWQIVRSDALNWEIQYQGKFKGYYGRILDALKALPHKMLDEQSNNSLADVQRGLDAIHATIDKAFSR